MKTLRERLAECPLLVSDGAWGTQLQARGLEPGQCPELWNVTHPERVRSVAEGYVAAGSDMILTNTFGGSPPALRRHGLEERTEELNAAGARISLEAVAGRPGKVLVAASIGPTGELLQPLGALSEAELSEAFRRQVRALVAAGVRLLCIETMTAIEEASCAVRAAREVERELGVALEIMATMTFDRTPGGFRTMMGADIPRAAVELEKAGADVLGSNCGNGIEQMVPIATEFRKYTRKPLLIQANAGLPVLEGGKAVFRESPEQMARRVPELAAAGASIIGGCCGTREEHIAAIRKAVDAVLSGAQPPFLR